MYFPSYESVVCARLAAISTVNSPPAGLKKKKVEISDDFQREEDDDITSPGHRQPREGKDHTANDQKGDQKTTVTDTCLTNLIDMMDCQIQHHEHDEMKFPDKTHTTTDSWSDHTAAARCRTHSSLPTQSYPGCILSGRTNIE